ncbi:hypothetical protein BSQ39_08215 [Loigolactobacillus backii]|uniref:hypothetical protein n=1 Tax=Loigolactobacillus backii TaxID=375175 RepID=UPI000C1CA165|nr:hypothetical protein [Loigolactobacillus backii]PIO83548.1 hypothetical protein BSQ39_08215 [Loigolactobacillus backii]
MASNLDFTTYDKYGTGSITDKDVFNNAVNMSQLLIDQLTAYFYDPINHDLKTDLISDDSFVKARAQHYLTAIALQCEYAVETDAATPAAQQKQGAISEVEIGRTTIQYGNGGVNSNVTYGTSGVVLTAANVLYPVGLLQRGVWSH